MKYVFSFKLPKFRQTAILDSEESNEDRDLHSDQEDGMSMTSSTGSSSNVVGRWWIGKDTRLVRILEILK